MKLLVTGGHGLLGSALRNLAKDKFEVLAPKRSELDLEDGSRLEKYLKTHKPDYCIHAAAAVYGLGGHKLHPNKALLVNSKIDINLISALHKTSISKFIYIGTVASYGYPYKGNELQEQDFFTGVPHVGEYGYAMAKRFGYDLTNSLSEVGTKTSYAVMTNMFGPNDNFNSATGHVIPSLISRAVDASEAGGPLTVWGRPTDTRDFMFSNAAAGRLLQILSEESISLVNIGSGIERSISSVVQSIASHLGISEIEYSPNYISSISHRVLDISLLESVCGVYPDNFEQDLIDTIEWYKSNKLKART